MTLPRLIMLHPANTTPAQFAALVGPTPGFDCVYPASAYPARWDHLGQTEVPALLALGGDFIAGYSSGGFMAHRMLRERQYKGAAIVGGGLLKAYADSWLRPCRVMLVNGTEDTRVPYGGSTGVLGAVESAVALRKLLGITTRPVHSVITNKSADGCSAYSDNWADKVRLYTVIHGGHTWPGSAFNAAGLGRVCMDFSATDAMRAWFRVSA